MLELKTAEREIVESAHSEFGEFIARFLLAGLGEEEEARRRSFVVTFTGDDGTALRRRLHVEADDLMPETPTFLPRQRDPLVLLALLRLLTRGRETRPASLLYDPTEVLSLLGWDDSEENRLEIEEAVERYFFLSYRWEMSAEELDTRDLAFHRSQERLISGYGHGEADGPGEGHAGHVVNRVDFSSAFVEELTGKSLFGVNWGRVRSVERGAAS